MRLPLHRPRLFLKLSRLSRMVMSSALRVVWPFVAYSKQLSGLITLGAYGFTFCLIGLALAVFNAFSKAYCTEYKNFKSNLMLVTCSSYYSTKPTIFWTKTLDAWP